MFKEQQIAQKAERFLKSIGLTVDYCQDVNEMKYIATIFETPKEIIQIMSNLGSKKINKNKKQQTWELPNGGLFNIIHNQQEALTEISLEHDPKRWKKAK